MSSSDAFAPLPSPWALDELEQTDVFMPMHDMHIDSGHAAATAHGAPCDSDRQRMNAEVDAMVAERLAQLRPRIELEALARGHAAGLAEAEQNGQQQIARVLQALIEATSSVQAHEQRWLGNIEENLAASAVTIARHLIQRELTAEPSVITDLVGRSLQQFPLERNITVRLHPDDLAIVHEAIARDALLGVRDVRWHADSHIVRGGCLVDGRERVLDGRIDTALERAYRTLGQVLA